jgi:hypothetical protein
VVLFLPINKPFIGEQKMNNIEKTLNLLNEEEKNEEMITLKEVVHQNLLDIWTAQKHINILYQNIRELKAELARSKK